MGFRSLENMLIQTRKLVKRHEQLQGCNKPEVVIRRGRNRLLTICRLWTTVDWFVKDYCQNKSSLLGKLSEEKNKSRVRTTSSSEMNVDVNNKDGISAAAVQGIRSDSLSNGEYGRLQRGFLLFELYRRLSNERLGYVTRRNHRSFVACLTYMEIAELLSVHDYLMERVAEVADAKDDFTYACLVRQAEIER